MCVSTVLSTTYFLSRSPYTTKYVPLRNITSFLIVWGTLWGDEPATCSQDRTWTYVGAPITLHLTINTLLSILLPAARNCILLSPPSAVWVLRFTCFWGWEVLCVVSIYSYLWPVFSIAPFSREQHNIWGWDVLCVVVYDYVFHNSSMENIIVHYNTEDISSSNLLGWWNW